MSYLLINLQAMRETIWRSNYRRFPFRWNNYKVNNRKYQRSEWCMQKYIFRHFASPGPNGFLNDVSITFIDRTDSSDLLKRQDYWRRTLKTIAPFGLNIEDSVWSIIMVINESVIINIEMALLFWTVFRTTIFG